MKTEQEIRNEYETASTLAYEQAIQAGLLESVAQDLAAQAQIDLAKQAINRILPRPLGELIIKSYGH